MAGLEIRLPPAIAGVSLPPAVNEELEQIADEIFWELAKDPDIGELTWEGALLRSSNKAHLMLGFKMAVQRYARELQRVPELRKTFQGRSKTANDAKRHKLVKVGSRMITREQRDAEMAAEYAQLVENKHMKPTPACMKLADKYGFESHQGVMQAIKRLRRRAER